MTLEEAINTYTRNSEYERAHGNLQGCVEFRQLAKWLKDYQRLLDNRCQQNEDTIKALEQEPCEDCISRQAVIELCEGWWLGHTKEDDFATEVRALPSINPQKIGHCKDCKYFEYDSVAKVGGIPLIVAHEICNKWGDGCKTSEEGFCFLFEPQESEEEE